MSEKTQSTDASKAKKTSLLDMKDSLEKKKKKSGYDKVKTNDDDEDSVDIDQEELDKQLEMAGTKEAKAMRSRPSLLGNAKWYDKVFFNWTYKVIEVSNHLASANILTFALVFSTRKRTS